MEYLIYFDIAALFITGLLLVMNVLRRGYSTLSARLFIVLMAVTFGAAALDIGTAYTISYADRVPLALNYLINSAYLLANNASAVIFYIYVLTVTKGKNISRAEHTIWQAVSALEVFLVALSPATTWVFYFDENRVYRHGFFFPVLYGCAMLLLALSIVSIVRHRRHLNRMQAASISLYVAAVIAAVAIQLIQPRYLLTSFASALVLFVIYYFMEKPADFMYRNTYCYNDLAFYDYISNRIGRSRFTFVVAGPENVDYLKRLLSDNALESFMNGLIERLHATFGQKNVFYMHRCHFAILTQGDPQETVIEPFLKALPEDAHYNDVDISLSYCFRILPFPGVVSTVEGVRAAMDFAVRQEYEGERVLTITAAELKKVTREVEVLNCIRTGLRNGNFRVYYQPILEEKSGRFRSAEALLRLKDPELGFIPPDEFIPIAERNGLIPQVGEFVLESVCRFWQENDLLARGIEYIEVNLSAMQCMQTGLPEWVMGVLERYGVPLNRINLEITETAAINNQEVMGRNMDELVRAGMAFSLDDYGTGYSNVDHLAALPLEIVKVDKSLVWKALENPSSKMVLRHTLRMIGDLGKKTVAEGVETGEMVAMLREMGCNYFQGFLYSRPIPETDFLLFLQEHAEPIRFED